MSAEGFSVTLPGNLFSPMRSLEQSQEQSVRTKMLPFLLAALGACSQPAPNLEQPHCVGFNAVNSGPSSLRVIINADGPNVNTGVTGTPLHATPAGYQEIAPASVLSTATANSSGNATHNITFVSRTADTDGVEVRAFVSAQGGRYVDFCPGYILVRAH